MSAYLLEMELSCRSQLIPLAREGLFIIQIHDPRFDPKASLCEGGLGRVVIFTINGESTLTAVRRIIYR